MKSAATIAVVIFLLASLASADERVILNALPTSLASAGPESATRRELSDKERKEKRVRIVARDGKLFWATREDRELEYHQGGLFHYFIDPRGGRYVKVGDYRDLVGTFMWEEGDPSLVFLEHVGLMMGTLTYFGELSSFSPPVVDIEFKDFGTEHRYK